MLEPILLFITRLPSIVSMSSSILDTVVLPLVPVTAMIFCGLPIYFKKSGQIRSAKTPGKFVPLCLVILSAIMDSFAAQSAT